MTSVLPLPSYDKEDLLAGMSSKLSRTYTLAVKVNIDSLTFIVFPLSPTNECPYVTEQSLQPFKFDVV